MKDSKRKIEEYLVPGGAGVTYESFTRDKKSASRSWFAYSLLSSIKLAIRDRAAAQARSTERSDIDSASAVSAVVKPAK